MFTWEHLAALSDKGKVPQGPVPRGSCLQAALLRCRGICSTRQAWRPRCFWACSTAQACACSGPLFCGPPPPRCTVVSRSGSLHSTPSSTSSSPFSKISKLQIILASCSADRKFPGGLECCLCGNACQCPARTAMGYSSGCPCSSCSW